jgi:hypothetical protein
MRYKDSTDFSQTLDVMLNSDTGEVIIDSIPMRPSGAGSELSDVRLDDSRAVFDTINDLKAEVLRLRRRVASVERWLGEFPKEDKC